MNKKYKLGVVGRPIEHSLSPFIHSRFSRNENINIEYLPYKVEESDFEIFIKEFFSDKDSKGLNVTLPYKKMLPILMEIFHQKQNI
jgi:shikimate dehydrogenase